MGIVPVRLFGTAGTLMRRRIFLNTTISAVATSLVYPFSHLSASPKARENVATVQAYNFG